MKDLLRLHYGDVVLRDARRRRDDPRGAVGAISRATRLA